MDMKITRHVNGKEVHFEDLKNFEINNDMVLRIIKDVNCRLEKMRLHKTA